jgi:hypothetical protein
LFDSIVVSLSNVALLLFVLYRIRALCGYRARSSSLRFKVQKPAGHCIGLLLAAFCAVAPVLQIVLGVSAVNLDGGETSMPPFEV